MATKDNLTPETPVSLFITGALIAAIFALYQVLAPTIEMVKVNSSQINNHSEVLRILRANQSEQDKLLLKISNLLSRIEGKLEK